MKTISFKEFFDINERKYDTIPVKDYWDSTTNVPVYVNPVIGDLEKLGSYIRGLTTRTGNIYVWKTDDGYHEYIWNSLKNFDPKENDFQDTEPDICFYLEKLMTTNLQYELQFSSFTGFSAGQSKKVALTKLMKFPVMQNLKPYIANAIEYEEPSQIANQNALIKTPHMTKILPKIPSMSHYFPGGKKYDPSLTKPEGTPIYPREGD